MQNLVLRLATICAISLTNMCASAQILDSALPTRNAIFSIPYPRPAISPSGSWVVENSEFQPTASLRLISTTDAAPTHDIALEGASFIYWYRWSSETKDVLLVECEQHDHDVILRVDMESGVIEHVTKDDDATYASVANYQNNYKFTLDRFRDNAKVVQDLTLDGKLVLVPDAHNLVPPNVTKKGAYFNMRGGIGAVLYDFGANASDRTTLRIDGRGDHGRSYLVSISDDAKAYFISADQSDTLELVEYNLISGARKSVDKESVDISQVILNPISMRPDAVVFEVSKPELKVLNPAIKDDIGFLSAQGWGMPTIADRSPNDQYWLIRYDHRDGTPVWAMYKRSTKILTRLANIPSAGLQNQNWRLRTFELTRPDEPTIRGYVALPAEGVCEQTKCPAVLAIHGGPGIRDFSAFNAESFWLTSRGIAVININYRGSSGFGKAYEALDAHQWNDGILRDVADGLDAALKQFPIDRTRIGALGTSFSADLALNLATKTQAIQCAVIDSAATDEVMFSEDHLASFGENSDLLYRVGDPRKVEDRKQIADMSPAYHIDIFKSLKLLQFHGGKDTLARMATNEKFATTMEAVNPHYIFVYLPNEGHGLMSPAGRMQYHALAEQFLSQCLGTAAQPLTKDERVSLAGLAIYGDKALVGEK